MKQKKEQTSTLEHLKRVKELEENIEEMLSEEQTLRHDLDTAERNVKYYRTKHDTLAKRGRVYAMIGIIVVVAMSLIFSILQ